MKTKPFKEAYIKKMLGYVTAGQMSFSRMVELLNEEAKSYALEACKESLRTASKWAYMINGDDTSDIVDGFRICKESIISEDNIPEEVRS